MAASVLPFGGKARFPTLVKSGTETVVAVNAAFPTYAQFFNKNISINNHSRG